MLIYISGCKCTGAGKIWNHMWDDYINVLLTIITQVLWVRWTKTITEIVLEGMILPPLYAQGTFQDVVKGFWMCSDLYSLYHHKHACTRQQMETSPSIYLIEIKQFKVSLCAPSC